MGKVTYLLGAGASAQCLPVVNQVSNRLKDFHNFINQNKISNLNDRPIQHSHRFLSQTCEDLLFECMDLINKSSTHSSIDTYAKKLFILEQGDKKKKLNLLKTIVSLAFIYEQLTKPIDQRYDTFFASILGATHSELNDSIRIITWNYDFQLEKAYSAYSSKDSLHENQRLLRVFPSQHYNSTPQDGFSIYKINGTTSFEGPRYDLLLNPFENLNSFDKDEMIVRILEIYSKAVFENTYLSQLSFSWENKQLNKTVTNSCLQAIKDSDALVIIGYSFPYFNRITDKALLSSFANAKIYVQDAKPDSVIRSLETVIPNPFTGSIQPLPLDINNPDQFYLPPEL